MVHSPHQAPASAQADKGNTAFFAADRRVVGAALSADVDAPTERSGFCEPAALRVNGVRRSHLGVAAEH
jgi:hypothetical protein